MKDGIRVLGIDDAAFEFEAEETFLTGVIYPGTEFVESIESIRVQVDGEDATEKVLELYENISNHKQLKAILTDGVAFAGFNLIDIEKVSETTGKPVVAVTKNEPDREKFREAMQKTENYDRTLERFDESIEVDLEDGKCFIQFSGCTKKDAESFVKKNIIHGQIPESIRVADMVGRALNSE